MRELNHRAPASRATSEAIRSARIAAVLGLLVLASAQLGCGGGEDGMAEIRALQDAGRFEDSIDRLRKVLAPTPELPEANYRLGVALVHTGNPSRSIWALEKASESSAFAIPSNLQLASVQFGLDNYEESIRASDRVLALDPNHREALSLNAQAHVGARQLEEALIDTRRLLELDPDDYAILIVHATVLAELGRTREAEVAHARIKQVSEASGDQDRAARGCLAPPLFARDNLGELEQAEELYGDCASKYPGNRFVVDHIARFFGSIGKPQRAIELIQRAIAVAPDDLALRFALATQLARLGRAEEAEAVLEATVDRFGVEAAGTQLARHYRRQRDPKRALEVIDEVAEKTGGGGDSLQFIRADLLVDVGQLDRAEELANRFEEASYTSMIRGRILLARGDAEAALDAFDEGIARWPNNAGARYLAGIAALRLGNFERAIIELRESVRADDSASEAARILARLYFDRREYAQAITFSAIAQRDAGPSQRAEDLKFDARALAALGEFERAQVAVRALAALPGRAGEAAVERAAIERITGGPAAAIASIEDLGLDLRDPANESALRALANDLVVVEQADRAIASVDRALRARPDSASLHALMGTTLARAYRSIDARSAFKRALAIDANQPEALGGMGALAGAGGDTERAIELFDRAAARDPSNPAYAYAAAQLLFATGDRNSAEVRLRAIVRQSAAHPEARNDLAWLLATEGRDLDLALSLAREASRLRPEPATLDTLGFVHIKRGENEQAVEVLENAIAAPGSSSTIHYHLAMALSQSGNTERARELLLRALAAGDFPEAEAARQQLANLDSR
jgi:tetratricopeptide (TPR) repeat protein